MNTYDGCPEERLLLSPPDVGEAERKSLLEAFDSNWVAPVGPDIKLFEREMAAFLGVNRCVAVSSGTAALHLILMSLGVRPGDRVLVPTFTFAATANVVRYVGATPVFIDCDPATWTLDVQLVADELSDAGRRGYRTSAIIAVDIYGQCADYGALSELCDRYGLRLVEDAAESLGSTYGGQQAGSWGDAGALSFNGNKIITTGGGGMVVTNNVQLADHAEYLSTQARDAVPHYEHRTVGYNYRLSNILAAIGRAQLAGLPGKVDARQENYASYRSLLSYVDGISFMPLADYGDSNCWLTCMLIDPERFGASNEDVAVYLDAHGVETRRVWKPMHLQPAFRDYPIRGGAVAARLFRDGICLPSGSSLRPESRRRVVDLILSMRTSRDSQPVAVGERSW